MDRMLNDFVESIEFDFATMIDTTSAPMNERLNNKGEFSCGPEREPAVSRYVDEIEQGIEASMTAELFNLPDSMHSNETTPKFIPSTYDLYRDQHFAQAMEEFEMNMNLDDLNIFPPNAKTYHFSRSIQQIEGLVRIARQYMKKLAS